MILCRRRRSRGAVRVHRHIASSPLPAAERRLLHHLETLEIGEKPRLPARRRLEAAVGRELAEILLRSLALPDARLAETA